MPYQTLRSKGNSFFVLVLLNLLTICALPAQNPATKKLEDPPARVVPKNPPAQPTGSADPAKPATTTVPGKTAVDLAAKPTTPLSPGSSSGGTYRFDGTELPRDWRIINPDPNRWTMQPKHKSITLITQKTPCPDTKNGKNLLILDKLLPTDDFEAIVKASIQLEIGSRLAMILFADEANYIWVFLERGNYNFLSYEYHFSHFQKVFQGQVAGSFRAESADSVYYKIDRDGFQYNGYFANVDPSKPDDIDKIQWTKLGTLPWIHFEGKLALCAVNAWGDPAEVSAEFYSVLIRKK